MRHESESCLSAALMHSHTTFTCSWALPSSKQPHTVLLRFSNHRSDYVDGISPETVQASLGRDIGVLELNGARVSAQAMLRSRAQGWRFGARSADECRLQAVEKYGLELLNSELSIDVRRSVHVTMFDPCATSLHWGS